MNGDVIFRLQFLLWGGSRISQIFMKKNMKKKKMEPSGRSKFYYVDPSLSNAHYKDINTEQPDSAVESSTRKCYAILS